MHLASVVLLRIAGSPTANVALRSRKAGLGSIRHASSPARCNVQRSRPSPCAGTSCEGRHRNALRETLAGSAPTRHRAWGLDNPARLCCLGRGRYQPKPSVSPIVSTTTANHNLLISLNYVPLRLSGSNGLVTARRAIIPRNAGSTISTFASIQNPTVHQDETDWHRT